MLIKKLVTPNCTSTAQNRQKRQRIGRNSIGAPLRCAQPYSSTYVEMLRGSRQFGLENKNIPEIAQENQVTRH